MKETFSLTYPKNFNRENELKPEDAEFLDTLGIQDMVIIKNQAFRGQRILKLRDYLSCDSEVISYRNFILEDLIDDSGVFQIFESSIDLICNIQDLRKLVSGGYTKETSLSAVRFLEMYIEIMEHFKALKDKDIHSAGLLEFRERILKETESQEYRNLSEGLKKMEMDFGYIKAIKLGVNLDNNLRPSKAGILEIERVPFKEGTIIGRLTGVQDDRTLLSGLFPLNRGLHPEELKNLNYSVQTALYNIFEKNLREFEPLVNRYLNVNTRVFLDVLDDIRFYIAGASFIKALKEKGFSVVRPKVFPLEKRVTRLKGLYNPGLAMSLKEKSIISNDFSFDEKGMFYIVTGPNHGGKSIFLYSVGICQALFQLGLFVPCEEAFLSPVTDIFTHFPASDEGNYGKGRLEAECERLGKILRKIKKTDLILMDETFAGTSGTEAEAIAEEVLKGIAGIGSKGIYVTHIHAISEKTEELSGEGIPFDSLSAVMEDRENGIRSYKIKRVRPDGRSYARDIALKYGLDRETILKGRLEVEN